ncbi:hypothetical protein [Demequina sp. NBRC 110054]|uniref:hypothetical protein n=1 Tax=Demequina sp. NBRC 110054 TaxID=1570343 RepID=UPI0009FC9492|nr:hypothetical protein [Demequina sp. NBRC 110054]
MAKIMHITGRAVRADILRRKSDQAVYGACVTVLTEPRGDTCEVLVFESVIPAVEVLDLQDMTIDATVAVDTAERGMFAVKMVTLDAVTAPAPAAAPATQEKAKA